MSKQLLTVSREEIIHQLKLFCQVRSIIEGIINREIITSTAQELSIHADLNELQEAADAVRLTHNLRRADETYAWLQKHCLSVDEFEEIAYITLISAKVAEHLFGNQIEPHFMNHQIDYAQAVLYEVILDDPDLAMELFYAIEEGEMTFQEVARQYISDVELRRSGGYLGKQRRRDLKPEISAAVFAATPPQLLKPIVTARGVHLIWVEELIQSQLDTTLKQEILSELFNIWLKQQAEQIDVAIALNPTMEPTSDASPLDRISAAIFM